MIAKNRRRDRHFARDRHIRHRPAGNRLQADILRFELAGKLFALELEHCAHHAHAGLARGHAHLAFKLRIQ